MSVNNLMNGFLALSSELTGFSVFDLRGTGEADAYLEAAAQDAGEELLAQLIDVHGGLDSQGADRESKLRESILSDPKLGPLARSVIKVWFSGVWHALPDSGGQTYAVRPSSYAEGLLWKTIGANPPGARPPGYGSWAEPPSIPDPESGFSILDVRIV